MPTYEYECENGHRFEVFQSMKDEPLSACTECGGKARRRIGPGAGFLFKGSGFYSTEYRSKEYKEKAKSEEKPKTGASSGTPAPESKPPGGGGRKQSGGGSNGGQSGGSNGGQSA
jgi:putative FmdB family regulatory protein